jgi:hypothetical protein
MPRWQVSPICFSDPGMTNANMRFVVVNVNGDAPDNLGAKPELDVSLLPAQHQEDLAHMHSQPMISETT